VTARFEDRHIAGPHGPIRLRVHVPDGDVRGVIVDSVHDLTVGTADYLYDDSLFMAARWHAAGSPARVDIYPAFPHGFNAFPAELSRVANRTMDDWVRDRPAGPAGRVES